ncbi:MAG: HypC/HybG/HupF family hydrogenase formation chaperone [Solirubrobacterales bacterium]|jgi:hydrogenase maturation factor
MSALSPTAAHCEVEEGCITCGDLALPLEVVQVDDDRGLGLCRDGEGRTETVEIALVLPVAVGDELLVHAGTAISHLSREAVSASTPGRAAEEVRL